MRRAGPLAAILLALVSIALLVAPRRDDGPPLDPRSTAPLGTRALVLVLEEAGAVVSVTHESPRGPGTALLLRDDLDDAARDRLRSWVATEGGVAVVTDPTSPLVPAIGRGDATLFAGRDEGEEDQRVRGVAPRCGLAALRQVKEITLSFPIGYRRSSTEGALRCFPVGADSYLVAAPHGRGSIVALAGAGPLVNDALDEADNAVLAVSLLAPQPGTRVTVAEPSPAGGGRAGLLDLVSNRLKDGLWQLLVVFGIVALWRSRRLGPPVTEPQPVAIPSAELVNAVGNLLHHARRRDPAADMLRLQVRRTLADRLGLATDADPQVMAEAAHRRAGVDASVLASALSPRPVASDEDLVTLGRVLEELRRELTHA